ncbi:putative arabinose-binding protein precursor [compost metagenome]
MKRKFSVLGLILIIALTTILSACSGSGADSTDSAESSSPDSKGSSKKPVTIEFWGRWDAATQYINETIESFQKEHPHITVKYSLVPTNQYVQQLQSAISGNNLPDIFANYAQLPTYQLEKMNVLHPLNELFTQAERDSYYNGVWSEGSTVINGEIYAIPLYSPLRPGMVMYYNKALMTTAGLTEADVPKTWDELYTFSKKVKEATNGAAYGLVTGVKALSFLPYAISQMATAVSPEVISNVLGPFNYLTGKYEFNSEGLVKSLEYFKKLQDEKLLHPNSIVMNFREGTGLFEAGKAALTIDGAFYAPQLPKELWSQIGVAPVPTMDGKPQYVAYSGGSGDSFHVSKSTKNFAEVKLFIKYMTEHLHKKTAAAGISYSPIKSQNENLIFGNPVAQQALKVENSQFVLVPRPFEKNAATLKVSTEMSGKLPQLTLASLTEGYLSGQIKDIRQALTQLSDETNKLFEATIKKVQDAGEKVSKDDYIYPDWKPFENYTTVKK